MFSLTFSILFLYFFVFLIESTNSPSHTLRSQEMSAMLINNDKIQINKPSSSRLLVRYLKICLSLEKVLSPRSVEISNKLRSANW